MAAPPIAYVIDISLGQNRAAAITGTQEQNIFHAQQLGSRYDSFVTRMRRLCQLPEDKKVPQKRGPRISIF